MWWAKLANLLSDPMTLLIQLGQAQPWLYSLLVALFALCIGSFLNVVIHRLPIMLERQWREEYRDYFTPDEREDVPPFNLMVPRSRCPSCGHGITAAENIPLLSWLWLRGRCSACKAPISVRYPLVELVTALLSLVVSWQLPAGWPTLAGLLLTWSLIPLTLIDLDRMLLPDQITLPLLWGGLFFNLVGGFVPLTDAVIGAMVGYLTLWGLYWAFKLLTGKEGMGYGDFKLLAALGAWLGWQALPLILLLSALVGALIGLSLIALRRHQQGNPIPFGPYLAMAGWIALLWGDEITRWYLSTVL